VGGLECFFSSRLVVVVVVVIVGGCVSRSIDRSLALSGRVVESFLGREVKRRETERREGGDGSKNRWQVVVLEAAAVWKAAVQ
jgi:hypothetical protein